ncbi:C45 family peptidase [Saccharomonospora sp. NPDC006951]
MGINTEVVAGSADDFMLVRHLRVTGTQTEIGRALAEEAYERGGWRPMAADPVRNRARLAWFERYWPQHRARMEGAAAVLGTTVESARVYLDEVATVPGGSACTATWCAPSATREGHGFLGRNYDFFTVGWEQLFAMISGERAEDDGSLPAAARPYVITSVPDDAPATTLITMNELDGCMEGINEHGLAVALLIADMETAGEPSDAGPQVGIGSAQLPRFVLDTCENVEQAQRALLGAKQYDLGTPLHYLIADRHGDAFVWETGPGGSEYIVPADGEALCVTNHLLHKRHDPGNAPADNDETVRSYERLETIRDRTKSGPMSAGAVRDALDEVAFDSRNAGAYPVRTLWRTVFDLDERSMTTHFFLGDEPDGTNRYSEEVVFRPGGHAA